MCQSTDRQLHAPAGFSFLEDGVGRPPATVPVMLCSDWYSPEVS